MNVYLLKCNEKIPSVVVSVEKDAVSVVLLSVVSIPGECQLHLNTFIKR